MKIRLRLTLLMTAIIATILLAFAVSIYYLYAKNREEEYSKQLRQQATTKANLLLDAGVAPGTLQLIYQKSRDTQAEEEVAIYDVEHRLLYHDAVEIDFVKETEGMLKEIRQRGTITFMQEGWQVVGFVFGFGGQEYLVTAAGYDAYGYNKLSTLRNILLLGFLLSIGVIFGAARLLSRQALQPMAAVVSKVSNITATRLNQRVDQGNGKDEIAELAITFNQMLDRLENSFNAQKAFVGNIAHELRTPLAAMIAELELIRQRPRQLGEYQQAIDLALEDARKVSRLASGLMDMAKADYDQVTISFKPLRLDELLLDARMELLKGNPGYSVEIAFEQELEEDRFISLKGNEYLLKNALLNVLENGCKFSQDRHCRAIIRHTSQEVILSVADSGIGIAAEDLPHVFTPFYRGANKTFAAGSGIGLSLTSKVIALHQGRIQLESAAGKGTGVHIFLPHL
jgi:signal transduction histidine kinase